MANKIYITFRKAEYNKWQGKYSPSYILWRQFADYDGLINIIDNIIPEDRYIKINPNGLKNETKFGYYEYVDWMDVNELIASINKVASYNAITIFNTPAEAIADVKSRTNLEVVDETLDDNWQTIATTFLISPETTDVDWTIIPASYLIID